MCLIDHAESSQMDLTRAKVKWAEQVEKQK